MQINKKGWKSIKFGELCKNVNTTVRNPMDNGIERYVGLEHIEPGNLHITSWGNIVDGTTFTKGFEPGHILFGKRRAYQKKVAVADFAGLCSGDILVLEANEKLIDPKLLPFLVSSDRFFDHAVQTSAGSLSPRTKFQDLAKLDFLLPPKEDQARMAELLWAADEVVEKYDVMESTVGYINEVYFKHCFAEMLLSAECLKFDQIGNWYSGGTPSKSSRAFWQNGTLLWVTPKDAKGTVISDSEDKVTEFALENSSQRLHASAAFCVVWRSGILQHTLPIVKVTHDFTVNQDMKVFEPHPMVLSEYVRIYLLTFQDVIREKCVKSGTTVQSIDTDRFLSWEIPVPSIDIQKDVVTKYSQIIASFQKSVEILQTGDTIKKQLINQIFS